MTVTKPLFTDMAPLVSSRTLSHFSDELKRRRLNREKRSKQLRQIQLEKEREEQLQREKELERARERERVSSAASSIISSTSYLAVTASNVPSNESDPTAKEGSTIPPEDPQAQAQSQPQGVSFAQALMGKKPKQKQKQKSKPPANSSFSSSKKNQIILFSTSGSRGHH